MRDPRPGWQSALGRRTLGSLGEGTRLNEMMLSAMQVLPPWVAVENGEPLVLQLTREVRRAHPLFEVAATALARRCDNDDVLFQVDLAEARFAVVHLTWSLRGTDSIWPHTTFYRDLNDWTGRCMVRDHLESQDTEGEVTKRPELGSAG